MRRVGPTLLRLIAASRPASWPKNWGAACVLDSGPDVVQEVRELTKGGAHAVIDFVGEKGAEQLCWQMLRRGGTYHVVEGDGEFGSRRLIWLTTR